MSSNIFTDKTRNIFELILHRYFGPDFIQKSDRNANMLQKSDQRINTLVK